jgi:hypothetical protein
MDIEILTTHLELEIHDFSGTAINKDYAGTAFRLMDKNVERDQDKGIEKQGTQHVGL